MFGFIIMMHYVVRMYSRHWDWVVAKFLFVEATETGVIDLSTLLSNFVKEKECSNVTVQLTPGAVYKVSELKIPGLDNILFTSTEANEIIVHSLL